MATVEKEIEVPKAKLVKEHPLLKLCVAKTAIVVQEKGGVLSKGIAVSFRKNYLKLVDAEITGRNFTTKAPWLLIEANAIAHIHPQSEVTPIGDLASPVHSEEPNI